MWLFVVIVFVFGQVCVDAAAYSIQANDSILFYGGMNTLIGTSMPHGFANIFKKEVQTLYKNLTFVNGGYAGLDGSQMFDKLNTILTSSYKPNKVIFASGIEMLKDKTDPSSYSALRFELESIVARFVQDGIQVILCPLPIKGERVDLEKELDETIATYIDMNKQVARDYDVMFVNLVPQVDHFLERNNVDKLSQSMLTIDGSILNEQGHTFVALALLRSFGITLHSLALDNLVLTEELRVHQLKEELLRVQQIESSTVSSR